MPIPARGWKSPTTATLSLERRQWLLRQAELQDFVVIEDDYEAENLYQGQPMPTLKSLDRAGRVIYIGAGIRALGQAVDELARARRPDHPVARAPALTSRQRWPTPMPSATAKSPVAQCRARSDPLRWTSNPVAWCSQAAWHHQKKRLPAQA